MVLVVKNLYANVRNVRDTGLIPGVGRSPGGGHGNPPQYSCLENPMDRGAWWVTVHRVAKSRTWLKWPSTHTSPPVHAGTGLGSVPCHHLVTTPLKFLSGRNMLFNAGWVRGECVCVLVWGCGRAVLAVVPRGVEEAPSSKCLCGCLERAAERGEASWEGLAENEVHHWVGRGIKSGRDTKVVSVFLTCAHFWWM